MPKFSSNKRPTGKCWFVKIVNTTDHVVPVTVCLSMEHATYFFGRIQDTWGRWFSVWHIAWGSHLSCWNESPALGGAEGVSHNYHQWVMIISSFWFQSVCQQKHQTNATPVSPSPSPTTSESVSRSPLLPTYSAARWGLGSLLGWVITHPSSSFPLLCGGRSNHNHHRHHHNLCHDPPPGSAALYHHCIGIIILC